MFNVFNLSKQRPIPSISASDSSKFHFHIGFRSFRPDFLSVFHGEDTVSPQQKLRIDYKFQRQEDEVIKIDYKVVRRFRVSILSLISFLGRRLFELRR